MTKLAERRNCSMRRIFHQVCRSQREKTHINLSEQFRLGDRFEGFFRVVEPQRHFAMRSGSTTNVTTTPSLAQSYLIEPRS